MQIVAFTTNLKKRKTDAALPGKARADSFEFTHSPRKFCGNRKPRYRLSQFHQLTTRCFVGTILPEGDVIRALQALGSPNKVATGQT